MEVHLLEPCPVGKLADHPEAVLSAEDCRVILQRQQSVAAALDLPILSTFAYLESPEHFGSAGPAARTSTSTAAAKSAPASSCRCRSETSTASRLKTSCDRWPPCLPRPAYPVPRPRRKPVHPDRCLTAAPTRAVDHPVSGATSIVTMRCRAMHASAGNPRHRSAPATWSASTMPCIPRTSVQWLTEAGRPVDDLLTRIRWKQHSQGLRGRLRHRLCHAADRPGAAGGRPDRGRGPFGRHAQRRQGAAAGRAAADRVPPRRCPGGHADGWSLGCHHLHVGPGLHPLGSLLRRRRGKVWPPRANSSSSSTRRIRRASPWRSSRSLRWMTPAP